MEMHTLTTEARRARKRLAHATKARAEAETARAIARTTRRERGALRAFREARYLAECADLWSA